MKKVKIGDVCDILNGFAFKSDKYVEKGIRIIRIEEEYFYDRLEDGKYDEGFKERQVKEKKSR